MNSQFDELISQLEAAQQKEIERLSAKLNNESMMEVRSYIKDRRKISF